MNRTKITVISHGLHCGDLLLCNSLIFFTEQMRLDRASGDDFVHPPYSEHDHLEQDRV